MFRILTPLDTHLKSKDFFNAAEVPTARFTGDKVTCVVDTSTMLGKTMPATLTARNFNCDQSPMLKREVCGGDFETSIARSQWGKSCGLPDNIRLLIPVEAIKQ